MARADFLLYPRTAAISGMTLALALCLAASPSQPPDGQGTPGARPEYRLSEPDTNWVRRTLAKMPLRTRVAQLVQVRASGRFVNRNSPQFQALADAVQRNHVGGITLFAGNVYESALLLNELQRMSDVPLFVAADFESGASFRIADTTSFPWSMAVGATGSEEFAYQEGAVTAREARALGVHWIFAPVVDVNNNPDNPVINIRSYGEDPQLVARLGAAFIHGARDNGVLTTAKHFPGHGDTATDSHIGLAVVPSDRARLDSIEMVPFRRAVAAGVDAVMTAHVAVPQVTGEPDVPATLSSKVLTDLLRGALGFRGLVVTDALEMGSITNRYWGGSACVRAIQAGADMLLLPQDADVAINEVVRAVERGDISEGRIEESVVRVLTQKTRLRLHRERTVDVSRIQDLVASPESQKLAQEVADRSITLLKNQDGLLPLNPVKPPKIFCLVVSAEPDANPASLLQSELRRRFAGARTEGIDPTFSEEQAARIVRLGSGADVIVTVTLVRVVSGAGTITLPENQRQLLGRLMELHKPVAWAALGNPYLLRLFPHVAAYLCAFSYTEVSQLAAVKALSGEIEITGRTPVSIPDFYRAGDGLSLARLELTLKHPSAHEGPYPQAFDETRRLLASYVDQHAFPGAALAVGYQGRLVLDAAAGRLDYTAGADPVTGDTIFDLASVSKAVGTTSAVMMLVDSGRLLLDAPVQDYLPGFQGTNKERVYVSHLLRHSAGLPAWAPLYQDVRGSEEMVRRICSLPLESEPGARTRYSDLGMILLGEIVARAAGRPLDQFLSERLFGPLGMTSTRYRPPQELMSRIAPTEDDPWRKRVVRGEVHDENAYAMGGVAGHAGLFSSARDLAVFAQLMLNRGIYDHRRYFRSETVDRFTAAPAAAGSEEALGWQKPAPTAWTGSAFTESAYGHTGFTGTSIWIDPERQLFIVLLTNRVHPSRENNRITEARRAVAESVLHALGIASAPGRRPEREEPGRTR